MTVAHCATASKVTQWAGWHAAAQVVVTLLCATSPVTAAEPAPACNRVATVALCDVPDGDSSLCRVLREQDPLRRDSVGDTTDRLVGSIETVPDLADRLNVATLVACRHLALGVRGPARRVLTAALNSVVAVMESEGRSTGAAEAMLDLAQVQIAAQFEEDAVRTMSAFDWAVRDMVAPEDAARALALGGVRLAEVDWRVQGLVLFDKAIAAAERRPTDDRELLKTILRQKSAAGM